MFKNNLKKKDIIKNLSIKTGFSNNLSKKIVDDLIGTMVEIIRSGNLYLKNIGSFRLIYKSKRIGRNPRTKEEFVINARNSIKFTPSKNIIKLVNQFYEKID
tara:strand:- start:152 stop:457 length:306 start_codon:yes stop_codon:yes gene_type:complete